MGGGTGEGFLGLANGSWYDGSWVDRRRDGFGTEEREREGYTGEWAKDVRAGTGVLTDAHGKACNVLFSPSGELLWKHEAVALQPITCHEVWGHQSKHAQICPQESPLRINRFYSLLCSQHTCARCSAQSHCLCGKGTGLCGKGLPLSRPAQRFRASWPGKEQCRGGRGRDCKRGLAFVWEPKVKHAASTG
jgi:hypothetical protein